jgi:hypothetical protein
MDIAALKQEWAGWEFDESHFEISAEKLRDFALACGEKQPRFVDPSDPDFQAVPNFTTSFHGHRQLPDGFPMEREKSFDGGKCVEPKLPVRPGDSITGKSEIYDIFEKSGRSGGMMFVVHRMRFYNQRDELVSVVDWKMIQKLG